MRISDVTLQYAREYCGVSDTDENDRIQMCMEAAKAFILGHTGLDTAAADLHEDLTVAYLILVNEYYTNRDYTVNITARNPAVRQILALHSVNYL